MKENEIHTCKVKTVISATKFYLVAGFICLIAGITLTGISIYELINRDYVLGICIFIFALVIYVGTISISFYYKKEEFQLYLCKINDNVSIKYIRENYSIVDINQKYILFTDKENAHNFSIWELYQGYSDLCKFSASFKDFSVY